MRIAYVTSPVVAGPEATIFGLSSFSFAAKASRFGAVELPEAEDCLDDSEMEPSLLVLAFGVRPEFGVSWEALRFPVF